MGWMVPLLHAARKRREGDEPCHDGWWALPLIVVALAVLGLAVKLLLGIQLPVIAISLGIGVLVVGLGLAVLVLGLLL